tara:strand:- start:1361 stop:1918 length:558 start_codon:yes stop_codon:yes gene_type:complete
MIKMEHNFFYSLAFFVAIMLFYSAYAYDNDPSNKVRACVDFEPRVVVCGKTLVSETRMSKAIREWERLGYSFGEVEYVEKEACSKIDDYGVFFILEPDEDFDYNYLAITKRFTIKVLDQDYILYSKIFIPRKEVRRERILEHEMGHAFGWDHFNSSYHIMHENWAEGGRKITGLSRDVYDKKCSQ